MSLFKSLFQFYFLWVFFSLVSTWPFFKISSAGPWSLLFVIVVVTVYVFFGLTLSFVIMKEICAQKDKFQHSVALSFTLVVWGVLYILAHTDSLSLLHIAIAGSANLLVFATLAGAMLSSAVKRVAELVPLSMTAAVADLVSVFFGPTKDIAVSLGNYYESGMVGLPPFADFIVIKVVVPGYSLPIPLFGVTDWIIIVLLSSALLRLEKSDNLMDLVSFYSQKIFFPVTGCGLMLSVFLAQFFGVFLPALPVISFVFVCFIVMKYRKTFDLHRSDMVLSVVFPLGMATAILLAFK